jgi:hypothetical protein
MVVTVIISNYSKQAIWTVKVKFSLEQSMKAQRGE